MPREPVSEIDAIIGRNLKTMRERRGFTQTDLAIELDVTYQQVQKYEAGANRISAARLFQCADFLDSCISDFFNRGSRKLH